MISIRSSVFSISWVLLSLSVAAQHGGLTSESRHDSEALFKAELRQLERRAEDFQKHQQALDKYEEELNSHIADYKVEKKKQEEEHEEARREYIREKKSSQVIPVEAYQPAYEAELARQEAKHRRARQEYARQREQLEKALEKPMNKIPEDQEVDLNYDKI